MQQAWKTIRMKRDSTTKAMGAARDTTDRERRDVLVGQGRRVRGDWHSSTQATTETADEQLRVLAGGAAERPHTSYPPIYPSDP